MTALAEEGMDEKSFVNLVKQYIGIPYRFGGASKRGMDCSGFVKHVFAESFSVDLPHSSTQQYALPAMKKVAQEDLQTGDLVFFSQKNKRINHVGIYLDEGRFIHASRRAGITISRLDQGYWKVRLVGAKRPSGLWPAETASSPGPSRGIQTALRDSWGLPEQANHFGSPVQGLRPSSLWGLSGSNGIRGEQFQTFGLELSHSFGEASWSMSLLQEGHFQSFRSEGAPGFPRPIPLSQGSTRQYGLDGSRHGVKMASALQPFDWLRIQPSFSWVGYEHGVNKPSSWGPGLGLAFQVRPMAGKWSFSADFQYWDEGDGAGSGFEDIDAWKNKNLSIMFGYDVSSDVRLKLVGQHGLGTFHRLHSPSSEAQQKDQGLFFGLDWAF